MLRYTDLSVSIQEREQKDGKSERRDWEKQIEMKEFRPEEFMTDGHRDNRGTNEN